VPVECLDLPGGVVKDQPGSAVGTPVASATTGWVAPACVVAWMRLLPERLLINYSDRPRGRKR